MTKTSCDVCEQLKSDLFLNCRNGMIICDDCIEAIERNKSPHSGTESGAHRSPTSR